MANALNRLGGLGHDAEARPSLKVGHIRFGEHYVILAEIAGQAAHFHMVAFADYNRMETVGDELRQRAMRDVNEWACCFQYVQSAFARLA